MPAVIRGGVRFRDGLREMGAVAVSKAGPQVFDCELGDMGTVTIGGREVPHALRCCPHNGWVVALKTDSGGLPVLNDAKDDIVKVRLKGNVRFRRRKLGNKQ